MFSNIPQSALTSILLRYLSDYLENIEPDLRLSFYGGDVSLNNVEINLDMINKKLGLKEPFRITRGFIKNLSINIFWARIYSKPVEVM